MMALKTTTVKMTPVSVYDWQKESHKSCNEEDVDKRTRELPNKDLKPVRLLFSAIVFGP